jgi:tRNA(fMet)-specific endonuclease VapC
MNGRYLLDTNILIALLADESHAKRSLAQAEQVFLPSIAIGELFYGTRKSSKLTHNLQRIDQFVASNVVLGCDIDTARQYGEIKNKLRLKGRPIPENDIWIAALAIQHDLALVTRDEHFKEIENLKSVRS